MDNNVLLVGALARTRSLGRRSGDLPSEPTDWMIAGLGWPDKTNTVS